MKLDTRRKLAYRIGRKEPAETEEVITSHLSKDASRAGVMTECVRMEPRPHSMSNSLV